MAKRYRPFTLLIAGLTGFVSVMSGAAQSNANLSAAKEVHALAVAQPNALTTSSPKPASDYGKLPISFEPNQGQADSQVQFLARGAEYGLGLSATEAVLGLRAHTQSSSTGTNASTDRIRMRLAGALPGSRAEGLDPLPGKANYFLGTDPSQWHTDIPTYTKVKFSGVYPGVDVVYYGNQKQLEYDFVVAAGANPGAIRLRFDGAQKVAVAANGDLNISMRDGEISFRKPELYQQAGATRRAVAGRFAMLGHNEVGFAVNRYDHRQPLVIDPVLTYSTYLGGSGQDSAYGIAVDTSGSAYIVGSSGSTDFPTTSTLGSTGSQVAFVSKLNSSGSALLYSTVVSGITAYAITVDGTGNAYVAGSACGGFPTTASAFQPTCIDEVEDTNAALFKLNATGSALLYATYLGGTGNERGDLINGIAVDSTGSAYVTGVTGSLDFPLTPNAFQKTNYASNSFGVGPTAFVTKMSPDGSSLVYSTYLGGSGAAEALGDYGEGIVLDSTGNAYIVGATYSTDFPMQNPVQPGNNTGGNGDNVFVSELNPDGSKLLFSTYWGGSGVPGNLCCVGYGDDASSIAIDGNGSIYITGSAVSPDFPTTPDSFNPYQTGGIFVSQFVHNPDSGWARGYSTFIRGASIAFLQNAFSYSAIAADADGEIYVTGYAGPGFTVTGDAVQKAPTGNGSSAFLTKLNSAGNGLIYSTFLGGNGDVAQAIALDASGNAYIAGKTSSSSFPVTSGAYQQTNHGNTDAFAAKFDFPSASGPITFSPEPGKYLGSVDVNIADTTPNASIHYTLDGSAPTAASPTYSGSIKLTTYTNIKAISVVGGQPSGAVAQGAYSLVSSTPAPVLNPPGGTYPAGTVVTITDADPTATIRYTINGANPTLPEPFSFPVTNGGSPIYTQPIVLNGPLTIKAVAFSTDSAASSLTTSTYTVP